MRKTKNNPHQQNKRLIQEVGLALVLKIVFILGLGWFFFGTQNRITTNASVVGDALLTPSSSVVSPKQNPE